LRLAFSFWHLLAALPSSACRKYFSYKIIIINLQWPAFAQELSMSRFLAVTLCAAVLSGCAAPQPQRIDPRAIDGLREQTASTSTREVPGFVALTATKAAFALAGGLVALSEGNRLIAENQVADPAVAIAAGLRLSLEQKYGMRFTDTPVPLSSDDPESIAKAVAGKTRYMLDVRSEGWSFGYFPTDWTHYRVMYGARARLIDTETKTVIAEGVCRHAPESNEGAPTYDQLLDNKAMLLKQTLTTIATGCVTRMNAEMLAL
jgi:hypothetical protein